MIDHIAAIPLVLALPGGVLAEYVAGSDPPQYAVDGELLAVDVRVPADLAALGWIWNGSFLHWRGDDSGGQLMVSTDLHPPPGYPSARPDCFTVARGFDLTAPASVRPAPARAKKPRVTAAPVQLTLFEEAAYV